MADPRDTQPADVQVRRARWPRDGERLRALRTRVFVEEQSVPAALEHDGRDDLAEHFIAESGAGEAIGTARLLPSGQIGRMAVLPAWRRRGIGRALLDAAVARARERGDPHAFLHAQAHAVGLYAAAGFEAVGAPFEEAGIPHRRMEMRFAIPFEPPPGPDHEIVNPAGERGDYALPALDERPSASHVAEGAAELRAAVIELLRHARYEIMVFSRDLLPGVLDAPEVAAALSAFARRNRRSKAHLLIHDALGLVRAGHSLLELARRLPSALEIRVVHPEMQDRQDAFVVADRRGFVALGQDTIERGVCEVNDPARAHRFAEAFDQLWHRSTSDPELRILLL